MRVLLLTQVVPFPPDSGPKVKTWHVLRYLARQGHTVTLATFVRQQERRFTKELESFCESIHSVPMRRSRAADLRAFASSLQTGLPFLVRRDAKREMFELIRRLVQEYDSDIVHADQLTMAQFALEARKTSGGPRPAIVFDAHNAVWTIMERSREAAPWLLRPALGLEAARIKRYEAELVQQFDHTLAVSEVDKEKLIEGRQTPGVDDRGDLRAKVTVIPIAVDCDALRPVERQPGSKNIMTMGTLYYPPNADGVRWFLREVYPRIRERVPDCSLTIVGPRPPRDIVEAGRQRADRIEVTGYVEDLEPYFERAAVVVVPVRAASGMRVRILEALARGIAVVTTTTGLEGIEAVNGEHVLVGDEPEEFATQVVRLLNDAELGRRLAANGRRLAEDRYDWKVVLPKLEDVYAGVVGERMMA